MYKMQMIKIDLNNVEIISMHVNTVDYPDLCDSFIIDAYYEGRIMNDDEIELLNSDDDFVYESALNWVS